MEPLSNKARALLDAGRSTYQPQGQDRERIASALRERLGAQALPPEAAAPLGPRLARWQVTSAAALGVGLAALGVVYWAAGSTAHEAPRRQGTSEHDAGAPVRVAPAPQREAASIESSAVAPAQIVADRQSAREAAAPTPPPTPRPSARHSTLSQEVALLARATRDLHGGQATLALRALDLHQRRFPNGVLSQERRSARAQALCALGRVSEGRAELATLAPRSPEAARAERACSASAMHKAQDTHSP